MANLVFNSNPGSSGASPAITVQGPLVFSSGVETSGGKAVVTGLSSLSMNANPESTSTLAVVVFYEGFEFASPVGSESSEPEIIVCLSLIFSSSGASTASTPTANISVAPVVIDPDYDLWNVVALVEKTRMNLGDPNGERWSAARVLEALNDCMMDVALYVHLITETISLAITADQALYDLRTLAQAYSTNPREYALPLRVSHLVSLPTGKALPTDLAELERSITAMMPVSTIVADFTLSTARRVGSHLWAVDRSTYGYLELTPAPTATAGYLIADYVAYPTAMDSDEDYPDTLQSFLRGVLAAGAASRLLDEGDMDDLVMAVRLEGEFQAGLRTISSELNQGKTAAYQTVRPM